MVIFGVQAFAFSAVIPLSLVARLGAAIPTVPTAATDVVVVVTTVVALVFGLWAPLGTARGSGRRCLRVLAAALLAV